MVRPSTWLAATLLAVLLACGTTARPPTDPVVGLIESIDGSRMILVTSDGDRFSFLIEDPSVPLDHLKVHRDDRLPVSVDWDGSGQLLAVKIEDA